MIRKIMVIPIGEWMSLFAAIKHFFFGIIFWFYQWIVPKFHDDTGQEIWRTKIFEQAEKLIWLSGGQAHLFS